MVLSLLLLFDVHTLHTVICILHGKVLASYQIAQTRQSSIYLVRTRDTQRSLVTNRTSWCVNCPSESHAFLLSGGLGIEPALSVVDHLSFSSTKASSLLVTYLIRYVCYMQTAPKRLVAIVRSSHSCRDILGRHCIQGLTTALPPRNTRLECPYHGVYLVVDRQPQEVMPKSGNISQIYSSIIVVCQP